MDESKIVEIGDIKFGRAFTVKGAAPIDESKIENNGDIIFGCDGKPHTMKEVVDFDDVTFDRFYQQMLKFRNQSNFRPVQPQFDPTLLWLQIITNVRENRRLEKKIDLLFKSQQ